MTSQKLNISVSVVIPLYNSETSLKKELENIDRLLKSFTKTYEIIVVDDRSTDRSKEILNTFNKRPGFKVYFNKHNIGIASNLRKVYSLAKKEYVVLYSIDGDWNYRDIYELSKAALKTGADIVIGRRTSKAGYSFYRKLVTRFHNLVPLVLFGVNTIDATSIKIFKKAVYKKVNPRSRSVFTEAEFVIRATYQGYKVENIPISYSKKNSDKKNYISLSLIIDSLRDALKLRINI